MGSFAKRNMPWQYKWKERNPEKGLAKGKGKGLEKGPREKGKGLQQSPSSSNSSSEEELTWTWKKDKTGIVGIEPFRVKLMKESLQKDEDKSKALAKATHIAIDWRLAPDEPIEAVELLLEKGFKLHLLSYCSVKEEQGVAIVFKQLPWEKFLSTDFCRDTTGPLGKGALMDRKGWQIIFDDNEDVCKECHWTYKHWVYPICCSATNHCQLENDNKGAVEASMDLEEAIHKFLDDWDRYVVPS